MKIKLGAVIPTVQYGNLQPEFEAEVEDKLALETFSELEKRIQQIWDKYGEKPLKPNTNRKLIEAFVGGPIYYDEATHTYTNEVGEVYLSSSVHAKTFDKPFDIERISQALAKKTGEDVEEIRAMWQLKSEMSRGFGTAIHAALELHGRFQSLCERMGNTTSMSEHPVVKKAVEAFFKGREGEKAEYEPVVVDHSTKRAGRIDRLLIVDQKKKICRVQDYKTDAVLKPEKLNTYWEQVTFTGGILTTHGWKVLGYDIFHWNGTWNIYSKEASDVNT